jgi:hypothetical protein
MPCGNPLQWNTVVETLRLPIALPNHDRAAENRPTDVRSFRGSFWMCAAAPSAALISA